MNIEEIRKEAKQEPYVRLLVCRTCKSIEELPAFQGPVEHDVTLNIAVERHGENHIGLIYNVSILMWESETMKKKVIEQIWGGSSGLDVFGTNFYDTKNQFQEDAMSCWGLHARPKADCPEFRTEKKRLLPGTDKERKDLGLSPVRESTGPKVYLCDFCPCRVYYARKYNEESGLAN